mgnify:CR=1 FL=1
MVTHEWSPAILVFHAILVKILLSKVLCIRWTCKIIHHYALSGVLVSSVICHTILCAASISYNCH